MADQVVRDDHHQRRAMGPLSKVLELVPSQQPLRVVRYRDDNVRVYKTVPLKLPSSTDISAGGSPRWSWKWRWDVNYSARTSDGRLVFDALPANDAGEYCGVLLLREHDELAKADVDPAVLRGELERYLPQFSALLDGETVEAIAKKPVSRLPSFRYVTPRLHHRSSTVLLGDAVHTVKPYFGLGG